MARKLNKTVVGILVLIGMALMTVTGMVLLQSLPTQDPEKYAADAVELKEKGEYENAMRTYMRAFAKDPAQDPEYIVKAAECALEFGDIAKVRHLIDQAKIRNPRLQSALRMGLSIEFDVTDLNSSTVQWNRVRQLAEDMLSIEENRESPQAHHALGAAYLALRESDSDFEARGEEHLRRAHELDPVDVEIVRSLGELLWRKAGEKDLKGEVEEADALREERRTLVTSAIQKCRGSGDDEAVADLKRLEANQMIRDAAYFQAARGWTDRAEKMRQDGIARLQALADQETTRAVCHRMLGNLYAGSPGMGMKADLQKAEHYLQEALNIDPKDGETYLALGRVYKLQRSNMTRGSDEAGANLDKEQALYERGLEQIARTDHYRKFRNRRARIAFIRELFLQGLNRARSKTTDADKEPGLAMAESWLERMKEEINPESFQVKFLTAHLLNAKGDLKAATREAEAARQITVTGVNGDLMRLLTELYVNQGQWGAARDTLSEVLKLPNQVNDPFLHIEMGRVLLKLNHAAEALSHLKRADPPALREALESNETAIRLRIEAYRQLSQFELAEAEIRRLGEGTPTGDLYMGIALMWEDRYDEAEAKIRAALAAEPDDPRVIRTLLQLLQKTNRLEEARSFLSQRLAADPDNRELKKYELLLASDEKDEDRDARILKFIEEEEDPFTRYVSLMGFYESREQIDKARDSLQKAAEIRPDDPNVVEQEFRLSLVAEDWESAEKYARRHGELNVDGTEGKIAEGRLALARGLQKKAADRMEEAKPLFNQAIDLMRLGLQRYRNYSLGWTYLAGACMEAGRTAEAKRELERALEIDPTNAHASKFLARIALIEGDENAERRHLAMAARTLGNDPLIQERVQYYREKEDPQKGIEGREKIRAEEPDNLKNLVLLARLYADPRVGEYEKAEQVYLEALKLSDHDLSMAREVAAFFGSTEVGRPLEGEKLLMDMLRNEEDVPRKALISCSIGQFFESLDELKTADRHYRQAVFLDPSVKTLALAAQFFSRTGRYKLALEHHEKILELARDDPELTRETQSRMIAIMLSTRDLDRAKEMIDRFVARYPDDEDGMIYEGAYHRLGGDIQKAKEAFDAHLDRNPDNPLALWQRGMLSRLRGRWEMAIEDLRKAKAFNPNGFGYQHRIALANSLIETGRVDAGISELQQIIESDPDHQGAVESLLDAYTRLGPSRFKEGENLAYKYMRLYPYNEKWPRVLGELSERIGDWNKAVRGYEKAAELSRFRPEAVGSLFNAFRRANRPNDIIGYASKRFSEKLLD
ncbi:MAG: tetratricopeptide repeat protein, partial [Phycisphaerae bacterium]